MSDGKKLDERFEREAHTFYKLTGMLAPGKSESPAECGGRGTFERREVREKLWDLFQKMSEQEKADGPLTVEEAAHEVFNWHQACKMREAYDRDDKAWNLVEEIALLTTIISRVVKCEKCGDTGYALMMVHGGSDVPCDVCEFGKLKAENARLKQGREIADVGAEAVYADRDAYKKRVGELGAEREERNVAAVALQKALDESHEREDVLKAEVKAAIDCALSWMHSSVEIAYENERFKGDVEALKAESETRNTCCGKALDAIWKHVFPPQRKYGGWEYPGQAAIHICGDFNRLKHLLDRLTPVFQVAHDLLGVSNAIESVLIGRGLTGSARRIHELREALEAALGKAEPEAKGEEAEDAKPT